MLSARPSCLLHYSVSTHARTILPHLSDLKDPFADSVRIWPLLQVVYNTTDISPVEIFGVEGKGWPAKRGIIGANNRVISAWKV
jgi:hypothetical protein